MTSKAFFRVALGGALLFVLGQLSPAGAAEPRSAAAFPLAVPEALGVNIHFTDPRPGEMEMLARAGFRWVRMDFGWAHTEREAGKYDFSAFERLLAALAPHHIRPIFIFDYSNPLYDGGLSPHSDAGRQAMARWAAAAAVYFRGRGILWEMYNEPNISFWKPTPNVRDYVQMALEVGKALRAAAPDEAYIGPATSQIDLDFLEECFRAGLLDYWSAVSVHPYRQKDPETAAGEYAKLRHLIAQYAPPGKTIPILSAEWGYSTGWRGYDDAKQARMLARQQLSNLAADVPVSIWYDWHDDGTNPKDPEHHFGTVLHKYYAGREEVYDPKPAYRAAHTLNGMLGGFRFNKRLILPSDRPPLSPRGRGAGGEGAAAAEGLASNDWILLFSRGDDVRLAVWTTSAAKHRAMIPASPGRFQVVDHTGQSRRTLDAGQSGLEIELTDAPQYLMPQSPNDALRVAAAWQRAPLEICEPAGMGRTLSLTVHNPLDRPLHVSSRTGGGTVEIAPHGQAAVSYAYDLPRTLPDGQSLYPSLGVEGLAVVSQSVALSARDRISAAVLPPSAAAFSLRLENPSGSPFHATARLSAAEGLAPAQQSIPVTLAAGQRQGVVQFPLSAPPAAHFACRLALADLDRKATYPELALSGQIIDDFSRLAADAVAAHFTVYADGDRKTACEYTLALADPPEGPLAPGMKSLRITYRFDKGWKFLQLKPKDAAHLPLPPGDKIGFWVCGDGQPCRLRLRFTDATKQTFQPNGAEVKTKGWRYVEMPLDGQDAGHWGGANDGVVHPPLHWDTLLLLDRDQKHAAQGTLYLAPPMLSRGDEKTD